MCIRDRLHSQGKEKFLRLTILSDHSLRAGSRRCTRAKARLGCAEMARACSDFVVCTVAYNPKFRFRSENIANDAEG